MRLRFELLRAWRALVQGRPVAAAIATAAALVACASSSAFLVASAAGSSAFKGQVVAMTPLGAGLHITRVGWTLGARSGDMLRIHRRRGAAVARAVGRSGLVGPPIATIMVSPVRADHGGRSIEIALMARTGAQQHVRALTPPRRGLWIADSVASYLKVAPGDAIAIAGSATATPRPPRRLRVATIYRALWKGAPNAYWTNFAHEIYAPRRGDPVLPPTFAFLPASRLVTLEVGVAPGYYDERWELPVRLDGMTLGRARALARRFDRVERELVDSASTLGATFGCGLFSGARCSASSSLEPAIELATKSSSAVTGPAVFLGGVGSAVALAGAALAGVLLAARRRAELRHRYSRGESGGVFAARTIAEITLPVILGGGVGFAVTVAAVEVLQPDASFDRGGAVGAAVVAAVAVAAAALLVVGAAATTFVRQFGLRTAARRLRYLPVELGALAGGIYVVVAIRRGGGGGGDGTGILAVAMPLLLLCGASGLLLRGARRLFARVRSSNVVMHLGLRRAAAAPALLVAVTLVAAVSLGAFFYGEAIRRSLARSTQAKAQLAVGGDVQGTIDAGAPVAALPFPATKVTVSYGSATVGSATGAPVDVMLVDPKTIGRVIHWTSSWGSPPSSFLAKLSSPRDARVPVVVADGDGNPLRAIWIGGVRVPVDVVAQVRAFPSISGDRPLVVASRELFERSGAELVGAFTYLWARGPVEPLERKVAAAPVGGEYLLTANDVLRDRDVVAATRIYGFLTAFSAAIGVLAVLALALYLHARQRAQIVASAFLRRMGFGRRGEVLSLALELMTVLVAAAAIGTTTGLATAAAVVAPLDPLPQYPPVAAFVAPWVALPITACILVAVAFAAAFVTARAAQRGDVARELRGG